MFYWSLLWLNLMKMLLEKQLIITGKMPVARMVKMNIFGLWLLNSFLTATKILALNLLALLRRLPAKLLIQNLQLAKLLLLLKNLNNFFRNSVKKTLVICKSFFMFSAPKSHSRKLLPTLLFSKYDTLLFRERIHIFLAIYEHS